MTIFEAFRKVVASKKVGDCLTRKEIIENMNALLCSNYSTKTGNTPDVFVRRARRAGFLELASVRGYYKILKHIPEDMPEEELLAISLRVEKEHLQEYAAEQEAVRIARGEAKGPMNYKALATQVGGNHYKSLAIQPIELIMDGGLSYMQGNMLKYITRYKDKKGAEDIKKCIHYAQLAIDLKHTASIYYKKANLLANYWQANKLDLAQAYVIENLAYGNWDKVIKGCEAILAKMG